MDKRIVTFGRSGQFGSGHLSHYPGSVRKNPGLAGIVQPYQIYVQDRTQAGPYEERTHLSSDNQDPTKFSAKMKTTHYIKEGQGESSTSDISATKGSGGSEKSSEKSCNCKNQPEENKANGSTSTSDIINEASKLPIKISQAEFKRKTSHLEKNNETPVKKKRNHKFNLV